MTKDEALKLALEALTNPWKAGPDGVADAIIALEEALAQPAQKSLKEMTEADFDAAHDIGQPAQEPVINGWKLREVYFDEHGEPSMHREPEPDELTIAYMSGLLDGKKQRPWAGLTDEETIDLAVKVGARLDLPPATKMQLQQQFIDALRKPDSLWMLFARDIEAKLKEKNT